MSSGPVKPASARPNAVSPVTVAHGIPSFTVLPVSLLYPEEPAAAWFGALTPEMANAWASRSGGERRSQPAAATAPATPPPPIADFGEAVKLLKLDPAVALPAKKIDKTSLKEALAKCRADFRRPVSTQCASDVRAAAKFMVTDPAKYKGGQKCWAKATEDEATRCCESESDPRRCMSSAVTHVQAGFISADPAVSKTDRKRWHEEYSSRQAVEALRREVASLKGDAMDKLAALDRALDGLPQAIQDEVRAVVPELITASEAKTAKLIADLDARLATRLAEIDARLSALEAKYRELESRVTVVESRLVGFEFGGWLAGDLEGLLGGLSLGLVIPTSSPVIKLRFGGGGSPNGFGWFAEAISEWEVGSIVWLGLAMTAMVDHGEFDSADHFTAAAGPALEVRFGGSSFYADVELPLGVQVDEGGMNPHFGIAPKLTLSYRF